MNLHRFGSVASAAADLAAQVAAALRAGLASRPRASLALPGGRTPVPLFHALRSTPLEWSRVTITLTDERWVPETSPASNAALVRRELLAEHAAAATFITLYNDAGSAVAGAKAAWRAVQELLPFDAVVLGMGADGHFASLFPGSPGLAQSLDVRGPPGLLAMRAPADPEERVSLNLATLAACRHLSLLVSGQDKLEVLERASAGGDPALPVAALLRLERPAPEVFWAP